MQRSCVASLGLTDEERGWLKSNEDLANIFQKFSIEELEAKKAPQRIGSLEGRISWFISRGKIKDAILERRMKTESKGVPAKSFTLAKNQFLVHKEEPLAMTG